MRLNHIKYALGAVFLISLASLGAIVVFINPFRTDKMSFVLFSIVLFLAIFSVSIWLGFWVRKSFVSQNNLNRILKMVFRQSALISVLMGGYLWLNHFRILKLWSGFLLLLLILSVEYYFLIYYGRTKQNFD